MNNHLIIKVEKDSMAVGVIGYFETLLSAEREFGNIVNQIKTEPIDVIAEDDEYFDYEAYSGEIFSIQLITLDENKLKGE